MYSRSYNPIATVETTTITTGTTWVLALAENTNRKWAYFANDSTVPIFLNFTTSTGTANQGIRVTSSGVWEMSHANGNLYDGGLSAVSTAAGSLIVTEGV